MSTLDSSRTTDPDGFQPGEEYARRLDAADPLAFCRARFELPLAADGTPSIYLCGNSLGLQPKRARDLVDELLDDWARLGVDGHFHARAPWYSYHEVFRESGARLVGAEPGEVVMMNSLTANLHLMMVSFFRPEGARRRILIDWPVFPSDLYAVKTHLVTRGLDPERDLLIARPREGEHTLRTEDLEALLRKEGSSIALVMLAGVNFYTGQALDMARVTRAAREQGCTVGFDLAHAAGNLELALHDWDVDFACWCSYKYLNAGPGAIAGCFVHARHGANVDLPRYGGWWGNDPETRFKMHTQPEFVPRPGADGWQLSNPPIFAMAPLRASLEIFDEVGMGALRRKSLAMTGYLRRLIEDAAPPHIEIITPADAHGCQLSMLVSERAKERVKALHDAGVVCDYREPDVIRVAPVPLYNTFHEVWRFARVLCASTKGRDD